MLLSIPVVPLAQEVGLGRLPPAIDAHGELVALVFRLFTLFEFLLRAERPTGRINWQ